MQPVSEPQIETATPGFARTIVLCQERLGLDASSLILDVPCGAGEALVRLARSHAVTGVGADLDLIIERAARKATSRLSFLRSDARRLPLRAGAFDAVLCIGGPTCISPAIEEQRAPTRREVEENLAELVRVVRPGGRVVTSDKYVEPEDAGPRRYDVASWIAMLERAGAAVDHFEPHPVSAWDEYLEPRLERVGIRRRRLEGDAPAQEALDAYEAALLRERPDGDLAYYGTFLATRV